MNPFVILNPAAGSSDRATLEAALALLPGAVVRPTDTPGDATRLAAEAAAGGRFDVVVAAGGDGTINAVVAGLMSVPAPPRLGVLPLGTGNDLARTLGLPLEPEAAARTLVQENERPFDVMNVTAADGTRSHAVNVCAGGFSGEVDEALTGESKRRWGPLAYVWTALATLPELRPYRVSITIDGGPAETLELLNVIVANGRSVAGGRVVAPLADPEDGLLDVILVRFGDAIDLARMAARLVRGSYLEDDLVTMRRARHVSVDSDPPLPWNADGELITRAAATFEVLPRALRVLVGPAYRVSCPP